MNPLRILSITNIRRIHTARPEVETFIGLAERGHQVYFMTREDTPYRERLESSKLHYVPWQPMEKFDRKAVAKIRTFIQENDIQILHLMNSTAIINGLRAAKGLDVKVILYRGFAGHIEWYNPASYFKYLNPRVDAIWCNSWGVQQYVSSQSVLVKDKAVIINKGHDTSWYDYPPVDIRSELGISEDALVLITAANNRPMKGVRYLLKALGHLPKDMNVHLLLAGRDIDVDENLKIIAEEEISDRVHFLGFRDHVLNIVAASDLFVLASTKGESITKAVLESMSLGVGAIISDIPGNVELVEHGENGLVFPSKDHVALADCIQEVYEDRTLVEKFGVNSKKRINTRLSNQETQRKLEELYEKLLM